MTLNHSIERLRYGLLPLSEGTDWADMKDEWEVTQIYKTKEPKTCVCGQTPILEICCIENCRTGHTAEIGNHCVHHFLGFRSDLVFRAIDRIKRDLSQSLNEEAIDYFRNLGVLNDWEYNFSMRTRRKRRLSHKQLQARERINKKVLSSMRTLH